MEYRQALGKVAAFVKEYYKKHSNSKHIYHNRKHIAYVECNASKMAIYYKLNKRDTFILLAATWLHDLGYMTDEDNHEEASAAIAESYLSAQGFDSADIDAVKSCIIAPRVPQEPLILLEQIVRDADLYSLGTADFLKNDRLLRKEKEKLGRQKIKKQDWLRNTITFLEQHHYHTEYCWLLLNTVKQKNLEKVREKLAKEEQTARGPKTKKPVRGIETMFKVC